MHHLENNSKKHYRTIWISDVHLGNIDCQVNYLQDFLSNIDCDRLYLVGDIVDVISLKRKVYWPASHYAILETIREMAANGTEVIYIPGNHDVIMRQYCGQTLFNVQIKSHCIHETEDGKRLLVFHGDALDSAVLHSKLYQVIGDTAYDGMVFLHRWTNRVRSLMNVPYWSLANYIKTHVKEARNVINRFENAAIQLAKKEKLDGVICGHIHKAEILQRDGILYCNDGDWTESCTALTEGMDGKLELIHWTENKNTLKTLEYFKKAA